ncbi:capsular polysaccharide biosynthesis protein [Paracoccus aurantiacus]|uniref:Capsular polysaccharide biosynthesis protein n=1 Tax=Paracoccus aurantiacus TaxID=2599412 RepID=A0A5C6SA34_9RHOB|nr:capsular polysaccharide biosynthesis protein [Paracoccus aurantiacus]
MRNDLAAGVHPRRLFVFNGGFLRGPVRRILDLAGWSPRIGLPGPGDSVAVWGAAGTAWRGRKIAASRNAGLVHVEDAFLRSVLPGRERSTSMRRGPLGLIVDPVGIHFDPDAPSLIETMITADHSALHAQARDAIARMIAADISKYNAHLPDARAPAPGYVLVVDQVAGDASLLGAGRDAFLAMLAAARAENPASRIVIRAHPETSRGLRAGHFTAADLRKDEEISDGPLSPWRLLAGAKAVYTFSSQLGYEAMLAAHRPRIFGAPFFAGWGLSDDEREFARRSPRPIEALFAASHLLAPIWYDPCTDRLTDFDGALNQLEAEAKVWRQDHAGHVAYGMRLWKRPHIARGFGSVRPVRFTRKPSPQVSLVWANKAKDIPGTAALRIEDGFLRSRGLGAELVPPLSLVADDLGIYYDPTRPSRLEHLIDTVPPAGGAVRAAQLRAALIAARVTKYNLGGQVMLPPCDGRKRILVPGQVEDDASIRLGAGRERTNLGLLERVRADNPDAFLIFKPHPDVEAGLRPGQIESAQLSRLADHIAANSDPVALLSEVDEVWTMTSTLGFEALLRHIPVTTLGAPFYAGYGLTRDLGPIPERRTARPGLDALAHAVLIAYPRYLDPVSGLPCPPETALLRLSSADRRWQGPGLRLLAKAQGALAGHDWIWRR